MDEQKPENPSPPNSNESPIKDREIFSLEIRSEEVQEIIGLPPYWLVRWGIVSFFIVLALIFLSASTIQYPKTIQVPLKLTAINAPKTVEAKVSGKIVKLHYQDNVQVKEGAVLAWLQSTADHEAVMELSDALDSLDSWLQVQAFEKVETFGAFSVKNLGSLQTSFQSFEQVYREFLDYLPGAYHYERKKIQEEQLAYTQQLLEHLEAQKQIQQASLQFAVREYEAQKQLAEKELIASLELERAESNLANQRLPLQQTESSIINNRMSQSAKRKEIMELNRQIEQQTALFVQSVYTMKSVVD